MATVRVNGVNLYYETQGNHKNALVLVHGSWDSHHDWDFVVPYLAQEFQVITYDRRGHNQSERPLGQGSVVDDVADLAALIEHLNFTQPWVAGNSFGASITLRLACERPELFGGVIAHEPPLFSLLSDANAERFLRDVNEKLVGVIDRIASGDHAGAAEYFVENVALGPGMWNQLPPQNKQTMIENAPTFLDEHNDPQQFEFDITKVRGFSKPVLLTLGDQSPPMFKPVIDKLAESLPRAEVLTVPGAGHIPHVTHPDSYAEAIIAFIAKHAVL